MKIIQITPAHQKTISGNQTTANRWASILRNLGHKVRTTSLYDGQPADMMVAIHAFKSAGSIEMFKKKYPDCPLIVCLGGTDINEFIHTHRDVVNKSLSLADRLVCLHSLVPEIIPKTYRYKARVVYQSAKPITQKQMPSKRFFDLCVVANLRTVKDPMRTAIAVRDLPENSRIRISHFGSSSDDRFSKIALSEMIKNPRYKWKGQVPGWRVRKEFQRTRLMVISSLSEGGANVVSEALVAGVPIIASKIQGNVGLLGRGYKGYFPVGDEKALKGLLLRAENEPNFLPALTSQCGDRAKLFGYVGEVKAWKNILFDLS